MKPASVNNQGSQLTPSDSTFVAVGMPQLDVPCDEHYITLRNVVNENITNCLMTGKHPSSTIAVMGEKLDTLAKRLLLARQQSQLTQPQLAKECGWESQSRMSHYERGKRIPEPDDLVKIAKALRHHGVNVTAAWLQYGDEEASVLKVHQTVARYDANPILTNAPNTQHRSGNKMDEGIVSVPGETELLFWYRRISSANRRKLYLQAELFCLADDPENADPFTAAGLVNLNPKEIKHEQRGPTLASPKKRPGEGA